MEKENELIGGTLTKEQLIPFTVEKATVFYKLSGDSTGSLCLAALIPKNDDMKFLVPNKYVGDLDDVEYFRGKEKVDIHCYLKAKIHSQLSQELDQYIQSKIHTDILGNMGIAEQRMFWENALIYAGRKIVPKEQSIETSYYLIEEGLITVKINNYQGYFNLDIGEVGTFFEIYYTKSNRNLLKLFYSENDLDIKVMNEKLKNNTVPAAYEHIAEINCFLENKKSVKLVLKNGDSFKCQTKADTLNARDILDCGIEDNKIRFFVSSHYLTRNIVLDNTAYLQYGYRKFYLDADVLNEVDSTNIS